MKEKKFVQTLMFVLLFLILAGILLSPALLKKDMVKDLTLYKAIGKIVITMILVMFIRAIAHIMVEHFGSNGTITNFVRSVAVAIILFNMVFDIMILYGADKKVLMSAGTIIGAIAAIGSKNIMTNFLAGVFLAVEELVHPFDFLIVNQTIGLVVDQNLFYVTIEDGNENWTKIHSKDFYDFHNLSFHLSSVFINAKVSANMPYRLVEELVEQVLENADEKYPLFVEKPEFIGISSFNEGRMFLSFCGACKGKNLKNALISLNLQLAAVFSAEKEYAFETGEMLYSQYTMDGI